MNGTLSLYECRLSGGDTQTLPAVIEFILTFYIQRQWGCQDIFLASLVPLAPAHSPRSPL